MDTHKGIDHEFAVKGQTSVSPFGWPMDRVFDSQKGVLKEYPFREGNRRTGTSCLAGLSNRQARFLSGSFCLFHNRDKGLDQSR